MEYFCEDLYCINEIFCHAEEVASNMETSEAKEMTQEAKTTRWIICPRFKSIQKALKIPQGKNCFNIFIPKLK